MTNQSSRQTYRRRGTPPDHIGVLLAAVALMTTGWGGLGVLITTRAPSIGAELWLFFLLFHIAITGTSIPIVRYINARLIGENNPPPPGGVIARQSIWIGLLAVICAWLQIQRGLSLPIAFFVGLVFVVIEVFLRARELGNDDEYDEI